MIGQRHRFHGHNSLKRVYQNGRTARGQLMNLKTLPRPGRPHRVAVVVSRKVSKSAVIRNRIRRRVYEQVRVLMPTDAKLEHDLVFLVFSEQLALLPTDKLQHLVHDLLKRGEIPTVSVKSATGRDIVNTKKKS